MNHGIESQHIKLYRLFLKLNQNKTNENHLNSVEAT